MFKSTNVVPCGISTTTFWRCTLLNADVQCPLDPDPPESVRGLAFCTAPPKVSSIWVILNGLRFPPGMMTVGGASMGRCWIVGSLIYIYIYIGNQAVYIYPPLVETPQWAVNRPCVHLRTALYIFLHFSLHRNETQVHRIEQSIRN
ncbi:hypothetical protein P691DRAFT_292734 [Macrolepiota fuliginosa MF-IS2]|uniref:Uncharacterized protein n=1 Tax=Macrolepiota fuliginosa MF-IS2 TaxID=1400762 RepID=A0A9P5X6M2_9AGAR|nr:hypothetical protein P691DRAFT_292734 [Macrolepiota fuliginosa MF-IS2]